MFYEFTAQQTKNSAIDALDKEMSKVSLAAADAKDSAVKGYNDGKQAAESAVGATKGNPIDK